MSDLPKHFQKFIDDYPKVADAYETLGVEIHASGSEEISQTVLLSLTTTGLPNMMASMTWVNDILDK